MIKKIAVYVFHLRAHLLTRSTTSKGLALKRARMANVFVRRMSAFVRVKLQQSAKTREKIAGLAAWQQIGLAYDADYLAITKGALL